MTELHISTPLVESPPIGRLAGRTILLKLENTQPAGTFKIRGIGNLCTHAVRDGIDHFVSSSGGNAGYASAYAGRRLGIRTTVYVPTTTSADAIVKIEQQGAEVIVEGDVWDDTHEIASRVADEVGGLYISPFDHPLIWQGHATVVDEISEQTEKPDAIVLSVGGGGLLCGVLEGLHRNGWGDVPVFAAETEGAASLAATLREGRLVTLDAITSFATSLGAKTVSAKVLDWLGRHEIRPVVVSDREAADACVRFLDDHRYLVEPACGATLAVPYLRPGVLEPYDPIVVIVCGGISVDLAAVGRWKETLLAG
jgi:L-serine/L-threonine ammonia-lyase